MTKLVVVSTLFVFSQVLFGAQSRLLGSKGGECRIPLDPADDNTPSCIKACLGKHQSKPDSFVCDVSAQWMHHVGGTSSWYPATPPQGKFCFVIVLISIRVIIMVQTDKRHRSFDVWNPTIIIRNGRPRIYSLLGKSTALRQEWPLHGM